MNKSKRPCLRSGKCRHANGRLLAFISFALVCRRGPSSAEEEPSVKDQGMVPAYGEIGIWHTLFHGILRSAVLALVVVRHVESRSGYTEIMLAAKYGCSLLRASDADGTSRTLMLPL